MFFHKRKSFTRMLNPDYRTIADGYAINYGVAITRDDLKREVERMLTTPGPFILECAVKEEDNVLPMTPPGKSVDEMLLEVNL